LKERNEKNVLLRVVSRIRENSKIYSPHDSIGAFQNNAVSISIEKFFIHQDFPASLEQLPAAVGEKGGYACFRYSRQATQNVFDAIRKLRRVA
jgi:hypothetical protein